MELTANAHLYDVGIIIENESGLPVIRVPVTAGVPFPRSSLMALDGLSLKDANGNSIPVQAQCLSWWPNGSCRWVLLDFQADVEGSSIVYTLANEGCATPTHPVTTSMEQDEITLSNGLISLHVKKAQSFVSMESEDQAVSIDISSDVQLGRSGDRVTSTVIIDAFELYAYGPIRTAVSLQGRRIYSDGIEGPFSQRVEMFADSTYLKVEDTFIYAHNPGTHAQPRNPLALWKVGANISRGAEMLKMMPFIDAAESDGLVVFPDAVAFWGLEEPFDLARHTDEDLTGEDCPGIALGVSKSCAALVGIVSGGREGDASTCPVYGVWAHTTPDIYAQSGTLGQFAPQVSGRFEEIEQGIRQIMGFWIWFQHNDGKGIFGKGPWHGLFDWGDWQTRYSDLHGSPVGWQYHEGRYGWDCGEMDTTQMLWSVFLHTGSPEFWRSSVAMSRHAMDVDMINVDYRKYSLPWYVYDYHHYDAPWQEGRDRLFDKNTIGMGRRHNVQHWGNGIGDTRHTFNAGIITYYYLTGNRRAYDAAIAMADMHMQRLIGYAAGEYTLAMECIYGAWQLTEKSEYIDEFKYRLSVIQQLQLPDGSLANHLDFDKVKAYPEVDGDNGSDGGLVLDYISNALCNYFFDTGDQMAREVLMGLVGSIMNRSLRVGEIYPDVSDIRILSWAFNETGDLRYLERVEYLVNTMGSRPLAGWPSTPEEWLKSTYEIMSRQQWRIRHIGPGVRMIPYGLYAILHANDET